MEPMLVPEGDPTLDDLTFGMRWTNSFLKPNLSTAGVRLPSMRFNEISPIVAELIMPKTLMVTFSDVIPYLDIAHERIVETSLRLPVAREPVAFR